MQIELTTESARLHALLGDGESFACIQDREQKKTLIMRRTWIPDSGEEYTEQKLESTLPNLDPHLTYIGDYLAYIVVPNELRTQS